MLKGWWALQGEPQKAQKTQKLVGFGDFNCELGNRAALLGA